MTSSVTQPPYGDEFGISLLETRTIWLRPVTSTVKSGDGSNRLLGVSRMITDLPILAPVSTARPAGFVRAGDPMGEPVAGSTRLNSR